MEYIYLLFFNPFGLTLLMITIVVIANIPEFIKEYKFKRAEKARERKFAEEANKMNEKMRQYRRDNIEYSIRNKTHGYEKHLKPGSRYLTKGY